MTEPTLQGFAAWLREQPAEARYSYCNNQNCPIAQYLRSLGLPVRSVVPGAWSDADLKLHDYPAVLDSAVIYEADKTAIAHFASLRNTYSSAAKRAEALLERGLS